MGSAMGSDGLVVSAAQPFGGLLPIPVLACSFEPQTDVVLTQVPEPRWIHEFVHRSWSSEREIKSLDSPH